jgi:hypothetical protein
MQHPAAKAALAFRSIILYLSASNQYSYLSHTYAIGKFQGTRAAATPTGCFTVKTRLPGAAGVLTVPVILSASPANHHVKPKE